MTSIAYHMTSIAYHMTSIAYHMTSTTTQKDDILRRYRFERFEEGRVLDILNLNRVELVLDLAVRKRVTVVREADLDAQPQESLGIFQVLWNLLQPLRQIFQVLLCLHLLSFYCLLF